ncbi:ATP-binding cassette domain-containing protein [Mechercharimyces sp. CAU 1602]|uniref:ATP-binding cassette domain-containing protein n=1 Tax=Mechercharimyces sp. CAU 1602 TaxID=2973933 RepID=UPI0021636C04|nr:ATP-binding cassette domain-containing protein [Mechercharimyces sp. CAU 1602]MCS1351926.1 ATP-binding cassette domain-containing protein [Mechercharimyces sp. CAU 1602]
MKNKNVSGGFCRRSIYVIDQIERLLACENIVGEWGTGLRIDWLHINKVYKVDEKNRRIQRPHSKRNIQAIGLLDFNSSVGQGVTVVLGPKGAGKSTLLRLTATRLAPDDGRMMIQTDRGEVCAWSRSHAINGSSNLEVLRGRVGYVTQGLRFEGGITLGEAMHYLAQRRQVPGAKAKVMELIARWGLGGKRHTLLADLNQGELARYRIAQSLLVDPLIWVLDDPTVGLDQVGREILWEELNDRPERRITLMATHDFPLAECAENLLLMESGSCRRIGKRKWLSASVSDGKVVSWYQTMQRFSPQERESK